MKPSNFDNDLNWSEKISDGAEIIELYEKKLKAKIIKRVKIKNREQQKKGYDIELYLSDGRILTIEEKIRSTFFPDILLETKHTNGGIKKGWLYKSEAEILAYIQPNKKGYDINLWKLKDLATWSRTKEFFLYLNEDKIKEKWSSTKRGNNFWKTQNYAVPFYILKNKELNYKNPEQRNDNLPLDFFDKGGSL